MATLTDGRSNEPLVATVLETLPGGWCRVSAGGREFTAEAAGLNLVPGDHVMAARTNSRVLILRTASIRTPNPLEVRLHD